MLNQTPEITQSKIDSLTDEEIMELVEKAHRNFGHFNAEALQNYLTMMGYGKISNLNKRCHDITKRCHTCIMTNRGRISYVPSRVPEVTMPNELHYFDYMIMKRDRSGYKIVGILIDYVTKFVWLKALKTRDAISTYKFLEEVYAWFGHPSEIKTDNAKEILAKVVQMFFTIWNIDHKTTFRYTHVENTYVEKSFRTVRDTIKKVILEKTQQNDEWSESITMVNLLVNIHISTTTKAAPFSIMFNRHPFIQSFRKKEVTSSIEKIEEEVKRLWRNYNTYILPRVLNNIKGRQKKLKTPKLLQA